jgi:hypothetical protein
MADQNNRHPLPVPAQESLEVSVLTFDVASAIMEANYRKGSDGSFISQVRSAMVNPYEPANAKGLRAVHPVLLTFVLTAITGIGVFLYFSFTA